MARRMAGNRDHLECERAERDLVALGNRQIHPGDPCGFRGRADQHRIGKTGFQRCVSANMVRMMMGIEDMGQDQTAPIEFGDRGGGVAGVNDANDIAVGHLQQIDIVILEGRDQVDNQLVCGHGFNLF